jgi:conjugative relaxase-like TrwC/TraI family protein
MWEVGMAATVTAKSGHHLEYYRQQAAPGGERSPLGYYSAGARQGEAPGRWFGRALPALGLVEGQAVDTEPDGPYTQVYGQVNPLTGEQLGRAPRTAEGMRAAILARLEAAEPHATRERHWQLARQAAHQAHSSAPYTDVTVSWSKSISLFHASIRENERRAREAGDQARAAYWAGQDRQLTEILQAANLAGLQHAETWAGVTRTGYHGRRVDGQATGRWEAVGIAVTSWLQGTSRDGDPHDHEHNLFARMVCTEADGRWRALDTMALRHQLPAMQAIVTAHAEAAMTRAFGVAWVARADGAGNEIAGITQEQMDEFSSRAQEIEPKMELLVRDFTAEYGRAPNRAELRSLHEEAWDATRAGKDAGAIDWDALTRKWDAQIGGALAAIAPAVAPGPALVPQEAARPSEEAIAQAARAALARVQAAKATWTRADYLKYLGLCMPTGSRAADPAAAVALLHETAGRALAGEFEDVVAMSAPEWPALPDHLVRDLDGRSVYTRPGSERYATRVQLTLEERLVRDAQQQGAPRLGRWEAAALIGADAAELDAQLRAKAHDARAGATSSGLRLDQGAALYHVLTSPRTAEVLVGPAGSGKTRTLVQAAEAWQDRGGQVIGLATSQGGRNVLANAGVPLAENTSVFLGHAPGQRGARGIHDLPEGSLVLIDEASMTSTADLADIIGYAAAHRHKVIVCGDHAQLAAVESGGGMQLLAGSLGHVQLAEAVRFFEEWEQEASLRLRAGDTAAVEDYDQHGRIRGGAPEEAMADARRL